MSNLLANPIHLQIYQFYLYLLNNDDPLKIKRFHNNLMCIGIEPKVSYRLKFKAKRIIEAGKYDIEMDRLQLLAICIGYQKTSKTEVYRVYGEIGRSLLGEEHSAASEYLLNPKKGEGICLCST